MRICLTYNSAAHYRKAIFLLIDKSFDCDYVFGKSLGDIKQMDTSLLRGKVTKVDNKQWHGICWQPKVVCMDVKPYDRFLMLGETKNLSTWLFCIRMRLFHPKKKVYFWSHGFYGKENRIERFIKKILFKLPKGGTFLYGNYARDLMIKEGFNPEKLFVIHNSLDYDRQIELRNKQKQIDIYKDHFNNNNPNIIFIGRLTPVKHLDLLINSIKILKERGIIVNLTFVGDGSEKERLQELVHKLEIDNNVWFYGACYDEEKNAELIYNADLCVSPGNVGLTAMHTMVYGTPVITHNDFSHQGPEFEAIHPGKNGDYFEYGDVSSLTEHIEKWLQEKRNKREEVRRECYKEIDTSWTPQFQIDILKRHLA